MADANHQVAFSSLRPLSRFRLHANLQGEADKRLERRASSRVASVPAEDSWVPDGPAVDWGRWPLVEACWMRWSRSCSRSERVRRRGSCACHGSAQELGRASCDTCLGEELAAIGDMSEAPLNSITGSSLAARESQAPPPTAAVRWSRHYPGGTRTGPGGTAAPLSLSPPTHSLSSYTSYSVGAAIEV